MIRVFHHWFHHWFHHLISPSYFNMFQWTQQTSKTFSRRFSITFQGCPKVAWRGKRCCVGYKGHPWRPWGSCGQCCLRCGESWPKKTFLNCASSRKKNIKKRMSTMSWGLAKAISKHFLLQQLRNLQLERGEQNQMVLFFGAAWCPHSSWVEYRNWMVAGRACFAGSKPGEADGEPRLNRKWLDFVWPIAGMSFLYTGRHGRLYKHPGISRDSSCCRDQNLLWPLSIWPYTVLPRDDLQICVSVVRTAASCWPSAFPPLADGAKGGTAHQLARAGTWAGALGRLSPLWSEHVEID